MTDTSHRPPRRVQIAAPSMGEEEWQAVREPLAVGMADAGAEGRGIREGVRGASSGQARAGDDKLHDRAASGAGGARDRPRRRGHRAVVHLGRDRECRALLRRDAGARATSIRDTYNIDPASAASRVTERTRAVVPVHLFGLCADMDALRAALPPHVKIVEDAACAAGAAYKGVPAGGLGDVGLLFVSSAQVDHAPARAACW